MNELVFRDANGVPMTNSLLVAESFGKAHRGVLRDIDNLECSESFQVHNFVQMFKIRELPNGGQAQDRYYNITKDGFTFLAMGYTGKKAAEFKEKYIAAFNAMERTIQQGSVLSQQFMETQMQMMNQMMNLCNTMMQRIERMESVSQPKAEPAVSVEMPKEETPLQPLYRPTRYGRYVMSLYDVRMFYPSYMKVHDAAAFLRTRGIAVYQASLFQYLRSKGFLRTEEKFHNRPSEECEEKGWMISTWAGNKEERYPGRQNFIPYLNPEFIKMLEEIIRKDIFGMGLPFGKEVEP